MSELLPEVLKGLKEYFEMAKAPEELAALIQSLGGLDERVLYKGYARYLNTESLLDKPLGVILMTNQRFLFITKKKIPFVKNTERLVFPVMSLEKIESTKYRLGCAIKLVVDKKEYLFSLTNLNTFATMQQADEVARIISQAKLNAV
jgi:hypothetical protein